MTEPLVAVDWFPSLDMRGVIVANALNLRDVDAGNPATRPVFDAVLGPNPDGFPWDLDRPFAMVDGTTTGLSTCAMVAIGILRWSGVASPLIQAPYRSGDGLERAIEYARSVGAWHVATFGETSLPLPGDVVEVDGPMHVLTVVGVEQSPGANPTIVSVDGGQVGTGGLQGIRLRKRQWELGGAGPALDGRRVVGWIDASKLAYQSPVLVPASYAWNVRWSALGPWSAFLAGMAAFGAYYWWKTSKK